MKNEILNVTLQTFTEEGVRRIWNINFQFGNKMTGVSLSSGCKPSDFAKTLREAADIVERGTEEGKQ